MATRDAKKLTIDGVAIGDPAIKMRDYYKYTTNAAGYEVKTKIEVTSDKYYTLTTIRSNIDTLTFLVNDLYQPQFEEINNQIEKLKDETAAAELKITKLSESEYEVFSYYIIDCLQKNWTDNKKELKLKTTNASAAASYGYEYVESGTDQRDQIANLIEHLVPIFTSNWLDFGQGCVSIVGAIVSIFTDGVASKIATAINVVASIPELLFEIAFKSYSTDVGEEIETIREKTVENGTKLGILQDELLVLEAKQRRYLLEIDKMKILLNELIDESNDDYLDENGEYKVGKYVESFLTGTGLTNPYSDNFIKYRNTYTWGNLITAIYDNYTDEYGVSKRREELTLSEEEKSSVTYETTFNINSLKATSVRNILIARCDD